jgi:hypothetical protein
MFPVKYGQTCRVELSFQYKAGQWILSRTVIVTFPDCTTESLTDVSLYSMVQICSGVTKRLLSCMCQ